MVNFLPEPRVKSVFTVVVPVVAPKEMVDAPPPIYKEEEPELKRLTVELEETILAFVVPLTVRVSLVVTAPLNREVPLIVKVPLA